MRKKPHIMMLSKEVAATTEEYITFTPALGDNISISSFCGDAAFSPNAVVKLVWKFGGTEEVIWTIKGNSKMPTVFDLKKKEIDGINQLALILNNASSGPIYLSGIVEIEFK